MSEPRFEYWIDRGGTFTDCLQYDRQTGRLRVAKVLSSDRAPLEGIRGLLGLDAEAPIPPCDVRMGTTVATNALLERKGTPCALVTTTGFADLLAIGTQSRPDIFALDIRQPEVLYGAVAELDARANAAGEVLERPPESTTRRVLQQLRDAGFDSVAVVFLHAYCCAELELEVGRIAREVGFEFVALSHEVSNELGMVARGDTTTLDAYLTPLIGRYVQSLLEEMPGSTIRIMQSSGGLTTAARFRGPHAILSGPAGGLIACGHLARSVGAHQVIGFDMGGTSTDASRWDGEPELSYETEVARVRVRAPMVAITTVAAGGGSVCRFDGRRFQVGPESAGADPGPLCYGKPNATELTVTDVNLALGRLQPDRFPFPLQREPVEDALRRVAGQLDGYCLESVAEGFFRIANTNMAEAIRQVSVARGYDVRDHLLVVFGGAGGQHGAAIARQLGIRRLLFHPLAGVLSAFGMGLANVVWHGESDAGRVRLESSSLAALEPVFQRLESEGRRVLTDEGYRDVDLRVTWRLDLRYQGSETSLSMPYCDEVGALVGAFETRHQAEFGYVRPNHPIEIATARSDVAGVRSLHPQHPQHPQPSSDIIPRPIRHTRVWLDGGWREQVEVYRREDLGAGTVLRGPALILEATGTIVVEPEFEARCERDGVIVLEDRSGNEEAHLGSRKGQETADPVLLEIMGNQYMSIAEQMGHVLRRTAFSTNIRERLDFSCAVFDADGGLVANAPHIPVHLGAMGESVRAVLATHPDMVAGDVFATNDPQHGGSHLPDVTVVSPVHDTTGTRRFFVASRGHHADIGGTTPGSMPPFSETLEEEGVVLTPQRIVSRGFMDRAELRRLLAAGRYPARDASANIADLEAQVAANRLGMRLLQQLINSHGVSTVAAYMRHVQDDAAARVASAIEALPNGEHCYADSLDDGSPVKVTLRVRDRSLAVDFTGTAREVRGNLNAPRAVTVAAVLYFLRVLVGHPIPLNSGCLRPVRLTIPEGSLLAPGPDRAVAGGNVETSQRVVDVLLGSVGRAAASQGTMNNLTFGNDSFAYYETIGGGAGAGAGFHGASGVHTHMTNTRITDPEVLESRFPVSLRRFGIRRGSGGKGEYRGGDGLIREIEFLEPVRVALLSERRTLAPFGLAGGGSGAPGRNFLNNEPIAGKCALELSTGDRLRVETPGGGGYGKER